MFKFLKDKIKQAVSKLTSGAEKEAKIETVERAEPSKTPVPQSKQAQKPTLERREAPKKQVPSQPISSKPRGIKQQPKKTIAPVAEAQEPEASSSPIASPKKDSHEEALRRAEKTEVRKASEVSPKKESAIVHEVVEPKIVEPVQELKHIHQELTTTESVLSAEPAKRGFFGKMFGRKEEPKQKVPEQTPIEPEREEKKGFLGAIREKVTTVQLSEEKFNELFWDLELGMLESSVAVEVIEKIKADLKDELTTGRVQRKGVDEIVHDRLQQSVEELFLPGFDLVKKAKSKKPYVIAFIGVNGSGKTTTLAKVAHLFQKQGMSVVIAASDTFRAAAIQQLEEHANKLGVKMIKHDYGSDPAAVAFDAISHAKAKGIDVVLIDTAGRLHSNDNLMKELQKLVRVNNPDLKLFIGEAITGNDCVEQAKVFDAAVGIDGIILAKADVDEKGGAAVSVSYVTGKPILYLGTGQTYDDLTPFRKEIVLENIGL